MTALFLVLLFQQGFIGRGSMYIQFFSVEHNLSLEEIKRSWDTEIGSICTMCNGGICLTPQHNSQNTCGLFPRIPLYYVVYLTFFHTQLTVSKDFSLSLDVPPYLIRGEEIVLEVNLINHLEHEIEVWRTEWEKDILFKVHQNDLTCILSNTERTFSLQFQQEAPELMIDMCLLTTNPESDTLFV